MFDARSMALDEFHAGKLKSSSSYYPIRALAATPPRENFEFAMAGAKEPARPVLGRRPCLFHCVLRGRLSMLASA